MGQCSCSTIGPRRWFGLVGSEAHYPNVYP